MIRDLAPRKDVIGGAGKLLFGERQETTEDPPSSPSPADDNRLSASARAAASPRR